MFRYYDYFLQARADKIQRYKADVDELAGVIRSIKSESLRLSQSRKELQADKTKLASQVKKRKQTLDTVKVSLRSDKKKLSKLQKKEAS